MIVSHSVRLLALIRRWLITIGANVISFYVLDIVAVACGFGLIGALNVFFPEAFMAPMGYILLFLVGTYLAWGYTLGKNLSANWQLLEATDTSTNVLSKAFYDLAPRISSAVGVRKMLAAAGYIGTELAKEIPYYVAALSAAAASDAITLKASLLFLGGANIGAAVYEMVVALGTLRVIRLVERKSSPMADQTLSYDTYEKDWVPEEYLRDYYNDVQPDERHTIRFFVDAVRNRSDLGDVLFFGCGPTLHHVFLAAPKARSICLADYLASNVSVLEKWKKNDPHAHNWAPFIRHTLACEGKAEPSDDEISEREMLTRSKITELRAGADINDPMPMGREGVNKYHTVISAYCVDAVTSDPEVWEQYMRTLATLVAPGGTLIISALGNTSEYHVDGKKFPCANVSREEMERVLQLDYAPDTINVVEVDDLGTQEMLGYTSIILAHANKS